MQIVQVDLESDSGLLTTWVDDSPKLKEGAIISLKDYKPTVKWKVKKMYSIKVDSHSFDFHRKWDNNNYDKHKGLSL